MTGSLGGHFIFFPKKKEERRSKKVTLGWASFTKKKKKKERRSKKVTPDVGKLQ
jgi:hypothetical protein